MDKFFLDKDSTALVIIDIQDRLAAAMKTKIKHKIIENCLHLIEISKMLNIPIILTEQYPKGLGTTVFEIKNALPAYQPIEKLAFNCCEEPSFLNEIKKINKKKIIFTGMETHICVLQTCIGILKEGFHIHVARDVVCSRSKEDYRAGIEFMRDAGAVVSCTETVLFQLLGAAGTEEFKVISKRIK